MFFNYHTPFAIRLRRLVLQLGHLWIPGEVSTPQHLEQKYVSKLSSSLKACDSILKNLLSLKLHRDYVEPFIHVDRKTESDAYQPMSLSKVRNLIHTTDHTKTKSVGFYRVANEA